MSLLNNPKSTVKIVAVVMTLFVAALFVSTCKAGTPEFRFGGGSTYIRAPVPFADAVLVWPKTIHNIDLYAGLTLIGDYDYEGVHNDNQIVARFGVTPHIGPLGVSLGAAVIQHDDLINSGRINFNLALLYERKNFVAFVGHISNAGTSKPNRGRDLIGAWWRFR